MAGTSHKIFVGIDDQVIELKGEEKEALIADLEARQKEADALKAEQEAQKELKISAYKKLGLTDEEIQAII